MDTNKSNPDAAQALEAELAEREDVRLQTERNEQEDLNQGAQAGTHDAPPFLQNKERVGQ